MATLMHRLARNDERVLHAVVLRRHDLVDRAMRTLTHAGDAWCTVPLSAALAFGAVSPLRNAGAYAAIVLLVSHMWVQLLKRTISRPRPRLPVGCRTLIEAPDRFSFPSGHAASSLSVALPMAAVAPGPIAGVLLLLAGLVGLSRCYLGVHYPGDVLMGWILAIGAYLLMAPFVAGPG